MKLICVFCVFAALLTACKKVEGEGGTSMIKGKVIVEDYNSTGTVLEGTYAGADEDIYILYGDDDTFYDDRIKTSYDGSFEFPFLENGDYTVYLYQDSLPLVAGAPSNVAVKVATKISKRKSVIDLGEIVIKKK